MSKGTIGRVLGLLSVALPSTAFPSGGLGATCWARPFTGHRDDPTANMCQVVGETQYSGINAFAAERVVIEECQKRNALDYGCAHGECCFQQCARVVLCLYLTPNKSIETEKEETQ